jgi:hypothetical protein
VAIGKNLPTQQHALLSGLDRVIFLLILIRLLLFFCEIIQDLNDHQKEIFSKLVLWVLLFCILCCCSGVDGSRAGGIYHV